MQVSVLPVSNAMDLVRKGGPTLTHVPPLDPLAALIRDFTVRGGVVWACPPCVKARCCGPDDGLEGVRIQGASAMHAEIEAAAAAVVAF